MIVCEFWVYVYVFSNSFYELLYFSFKEGKEKEQEQHDIIPAVVTLSSSYAYLQNDIGG